MTAGAQVMESTGIGRIEILNEVTPEKFFSLCLIVGRDWLRSRGGREFQRRGRRLK